MPMFHAKYGTLFVYLDSDPTKTVQIRPPASIPPAAVGSSVLAADLFEFVDMVRDKDAAKKVEERALSAEVSHPEESLSYQQLSNDVRKLNATIEAFYKTDVCDLKRTIDEFRQWLLKGFKETMEEAEETVTKQRKGRKK